MNRILLPAQLDAASAIRFASELPNLIEADAIVFDFAPLAGIEPFGMLLAGAAMRSFIKQRAGRNISADGVRAGDAAKEYLAHLGFFQWVGLPIGRAPGDAAGGANWMPITILTRAEFERRMRETMQPLGQAVQVESERFARLVTQKNELKLNAPLAYCFREVIRNVFEHAETDRCAVCAQKCSDGRVEIAIVDAGRGIRSSLEEKHSIKDDAAALEHALRPGVSRNLSDDPDDPWGNSGFGLYVLSELGKALGHFRIVSGTAALSLEKVGAAVELTSLCGTAIQLRLKPPKGINFAEFIASIVARGERTTGDGPVRRASASTWLSATSSNHREIARRVPI
jgi:anti-sigma regulatory factor (Ser/Thr protein kinase)